MSLRFNIAVAISATAFCLVTLSHVHAGAQTAQSIILSVPEKLRDPYVKVLVDVLDQWNAKQLKFPPKSELQTQLKTRLAATVEKREYPYETREWAESTQLMFDRRMPSRVVPAKQIDEDSALILVLLFLKSESETVKQTPVEDFKSELELPLFLILGTAQTGAENKHVEKIDAESLNRALLEWWTTVWPFCGGKIGKPPPH